MSAVIFTDVHADAGALEALCDCIRTPFFQERYGRIDVLINLGDLLHRGDHPEETLEIIHALARTYRLVSLMGNHDHAFLNGLPVSGSNEASLYRHGQLRGSPLLALFTGMPMEWTCEGMLFVHGGPLNLGSSTLRLKCWQRLGRDAGETFAGYYYTPEMAFSLLQARGLAHLCCGHQHTSLCCRKERDGIRTHPLEYARGGGPATPSGRFEAAAVPLDLPSLLRVGACFGATPEFACTDFRTFRFLRLA